MTTKNYKNIGTWWANRNISLISINGTVYALNGWNGESYTDSWKCLDTDNIEASEESYTITPVYNDNEDEPEIVEYIVNDN